MKTTGRLLLSAAVLLGSVSVGIAQTESKKEATVRIKKVENINGVEKITDTTYTTSDPNMIWVDADQVHVMDSPGKNGEHKKIVVVTDDATTTSIENMPDEKKMEEEIHKTLTEMGVDPSKAHVQKVVMVHCDSSKNEKMVTKTISIKIEVTDADEKDKERLHEQIGRADNKLEVDNMVFFPNPNNGKFNLKFNLKRKADASVVIYHTSGKQVYSENLPNFSGEYSKAIDISGQDKGIYFVKIVQGDHAMVKKIVLD